MIRRPLLALLLVASGALRGAEPVPAPAVAVAAPSAPAAPVPLVDTVITSVGSLEMVSTATETTSTLRDQVVVTATNLKLTCDLLVVVAKRTGDAKATFGKQENFKSLIATGHVHLVQAEREAFCDRAEILPGQDKVTLTGNPAMVRSSDGLNTATGPEMVLLRGELKVIINTPRLVLPPIKDLGPGKDKGKAATTTPATTTPPATATEPAATPPPGIVVPGITPAPVSPK